MSEKQYDVIVTPFAEEALQRIDDRLRIELFAEQAADNWLDRLERTLQELSFLPNRYQLVGREPWYSNGIRYFPFMGYNIYYWVSEDRAKVYVIDVVAQRMDQDKRLIESALEFFHTNNAELEEGTGE